MQSIDRNSREYLLSQADLFENVVEVDQRTTGTDRGYNLIYQKWLDFTTLVQLPTSTTDIKWLKAFMSWIGSRRQTQPTARSLTQYVMRLVTILARKDVARIDDKTKAELIHVSTYYMLPYFLTKQM